MATSDGGSERSEEDEPRAKVLTQFMLTFRRGNYDDYIENALGRVDDHSRITTIHLGIDPCNRPADWMERNAIVLANLKMQMEQHTHSAEEGREYFGMDLAQEDDHEEPVVWREPSINQYWEQLTTARRIRTGTVICIKKVEMPKEFIATLVASVCGA